MATFKPTKFQVDSNLTLPADGYTAEIVDSSDYVNANISDRVTLQAGFDIDGLPYFVTLINAGVIDSYYLNVGPDKATTTLQGRDQMAYALDTNIERRYLATDPAATVSGSTTVTEFVGSYTASQIATDIAALVGLKMSWQCRDYNILDSFDAIGRPFDILERLVEPWSQFEPLKVDIFIQGDTIICRGRTLTPIPDPALGVFTVKGSRLQDIQLRKFKLPLVGAVYLTGALVASSLSEVTLDSTETPPIWKANTIYNVGNYVTGPLGGSYVSRTDSNVGHEPSLSPGNWSRYVSGGTAAAPADWLATKLYGLADQVTYGGVPFTSLISDNYNQVPLTATNAWSAGLFAPPAWSNGVTYQIPDQVTTTDANVYTNNTPDNLGHNPLTGPPEIAGASNVGWTFGGRNASAMYQQT